MLDKNTKSAGKWFALAVVILALGMCSSRIARADEGVESPKPLRVVVMDPLAAPLSCPCVEGYAQRKYEKLGEALETGLNRPVEVVFDESLAAALQHVEGGQADLVIGKDSVVRADAKKLKLNLKAVARLAGKDGKTTQTGLIVVRGDDRAKSIEDLKGYRIIFGPPECVEKHRAALALLKEHGVSPPEKLEIDAACSDGAAKVVELGPGANAAAVISSYAQPLLEGCGTIKKGDLRVVGETKPVPFITAFVSDKLTSGERRQLTDQLLSVGANPDLIIALETTGGFVAIAQADRVASKKK